MRTYVVLEGERAIHCRRCDRTSWNENDVRERYCGACGYHDDDGDDDDERERREDDS